MSDYEIGRVAVWVILVAVILLTILVAYWEDILWFLADKLDKLFTKKENSCKEDEKDCYGTSPIEEYK